MATPAQKHFQRVSAAQASKPGSETNAPHGNAYEMMLMQLADHKRRLHDTQSVERKAEVKREILPEYDAYVKGVLEGDSGVQDDVLMTVMVWRIDAGDLWGAIEIGDYALSHSLKTPEQYKRDTATLLTEEIADFTLRQASGTDAELDLSLLLHTEEVTHAHDMPDEVRAKLHKAIGFAMEQKGDLTLALQNLKRALDLDKNAGVKKRIEQIERKIKSAE